MPETWYRYSPDRSRLVLTLHVQPGARTSAVAGVHGDALKIRIAAPAVDNKANAALVAFLQGKFGVPAARVTIRQGAGSRRKVVEIADPDAATAAALAGLLPEQAGAGA